jgi:hypothetical protein
MAPIGVVEVIDGTVAFVAGEAVSASIRPARSIEAAWSIDSATIYRATASPLRSMVIVVVVDIGGIDDHDTTSTSPYFRPFHVTPRPPRWR